MKKDDIEAKAKKAIELVHGIDEDFKTAAFSVIFERMLDHEEGASQPPQKKVGKHDGADGSKGTDIQKKKEEFAEKCGISVTELDEVFYFEKDIIKIVAPLSGSEPEKQLIVARCVLTAFDVVLGQPWVKALILSRCVGASKVGQLKHLAENLKKDKQSIRLQGSRRSAEYKITEYGKALTFEIIKKLVKGGSL